MFFPDPSTPVMDQFAQTPSNCDGPHPTETFGNPVGPISDNGTNEIITPLPTAGGAFQGSISYDNATNAGDEPGADMTMTWNLHQGPAPPSTPTLDDTWRHNSPDAPNTTCSCKDPVNTATGEYWTTSTDVAVPGRGVPLDLTRGYSSSSASAPGRFGNGWFDSYDESLNSNGTETTVTESNGGAITFVLDGTNWVAPTRYNATLTENTDGTWSFTRADGVTLHFDSGGILTSETDRDGYLTTLGYNAEEQLVTVTDPSGRTLSFTYSGTHVSRVTDPLGLYLTYTYGAAGNLLSVTDRAGDKTTYGYDLNDRMVSWTDPRGGVTKISYDSEGRAITTTDPLGASTTYSYASGTNGASQTTVTLPSQKKEIFNYVNFQLVSLTEGAGTSAAATYTYTYDPVADNVATFTDPDGHKTTYTYDPSGDVLTETDASGHTTTTTWDAFHDLLTTTDPDGFTTTYTYDAEGNPTSTSKVLNTDHSTLSITAAYDPAHPGDLITVTDPLGHVTSYSYDAYGDRASATDPDGDTTTYVYDADGRNVSSVAARGNVKGGTPGLFTTHHSYDNDGRLLSTTNPTGAVTLHSYDGDGNMVTTTDPTGSVTTTAFDADNEPTSVSQSSPGTQLPFTTSAAYDLDGDIAAKTDGSGHVTTYTYDALDRVATMSRDGVHQTTDSYDAASNLVKVVDPSGRTTTIAYTPENQRASVTYSSGQPGTQTYMYDPDDRLVETVDATGTSKLTYDSLGRLTSHTDGSGRTVSYAYDHDGNVIGITYANGSTVTRTFDPAGRMTSVTDWLGNATTFGYNPDGDLTTEALPNHTATTMTYNGDDDSLTAKTVTTTGTPKTLLSLVDTRTSAGLVSSEQSSGSQPTATTQFAEDGGERVTSAITGSGTSSFAYGANDAVTTMAMPSGSTSLTYDAEGQLASTTAGPTTTDYTYDLEGERTGAGAASMVWDQAGELTAFDSGSTSVHFTYDTLGERETKTVGATTDHFTYDVTNSPSPLILADSVKSYVYGPGGLPIEQIANATSAPTYFTHDQLGSTRLLTGPTGAVVATYTYSAYGTSSHTGTGSTPLMFAGQYSDAETGLYLMGSRYYDPATAQFLSIDPLVQLTGESYAYGDDDPVDRIDPTGLLSVGAALSGIGTIADAVGAGLAVGGAVACIVAEPCALVVGAVTVVAVAAVGAAASTAGAVLSCRGSEITSNACSAAQVQLGVGAAGLIIATGGAAAPEEAAGFGAYDALGTVASGASVGVDAQVDDHPPSEAPAFPEPMGCATV
jgi:RHS repeat-associated protein